MYVAWPSIPVRSMDLSLAFYRDGLGFQVVRCWEDHGELRWCRLARDGVALMLHVPKRGLPVNEGEQVNLFFQCDDARQLHHELKDRGLEPSEPHDEFFGVREVQVTDPDGRRLWFHSAIPTGE